MTVIVTDGGFAPGDGATPDVELLPDTDPAEAASRALGADLVRIAFPSFSDGRGFSLARRLRLAGFRGRLRASGHVLADQYAMARRAGFDEVEIDDDLASRQPEAQWLARADWRAHDHRARLGRTG